MAPVDKYAIFFPEADGYLFCGHLGMGSEGNTSIVRSIVDNQDYVRKKTKPTSASSSQKGGVYNAEVSFYRPHPRIPALVHSQDFRVLPPDHPRVNHFKSTSMLFQYCNGGTLERFMNILGRERILAPEVLFWHLLDNVFEVIEHLHKGSSPVSHGDLHEGNIYLHYPTPDSKLPEFFVGDLGYARPVDPSVWELAGNPPTRQLRDVNIIRSEDEQAQREYRIMKEVGGVAAQGLPAQPPPSRTDQIVSMVDDLKNVRTALKTLLQGHGQNPQNMKYAPFRAGNVVNDIMMANPNDYNAFVGFRQVIRQLARSARENTGVLPDFQWTRQDRYRDDFPPGVFRPPFPWTTYSQHHAVHAQLRGRLTKVWQYTPVPEIRLFNSRHELLHLSAAVPGPWRIARVAPGTLQVLAVELLTFGLHVPSVKDNLPLSSSGRPMNQDDVLMADQLVATEVDRIGMPNITAAAVGSVSGHSHHPFFNVDRAWSQERLSKQGQLTLRATALVPPPQPSPPAPQTPLPAPAAGPSTPRRPSPTLSEEAQALEDAFAEAQTPPETKQAPEALQRDPPAAQQQQQQQQQTPPSPSPPAPQTPPAQQQASPSRPSYSPLTPSPPPPPAPKTPLAHKQASPPRPSFSPLTPPPPSPPPPRPAAQPAAAAPVSAPAPAPANRVVKNTTKGGRKGAIGQAKGVTATDPPAARSHPAARRPRAPPPPSRVTTRSMARQQALASIIWTRGRTRAAAAAAAAAVQRN
ncbi:uncharacterized protein Z520_09434 [Fonsecaea multimorphosa CBS 102226]|uniref:Protein kinase domain-containing protein n=1 Tax=Fonsecaea multimorphosa CBS 102226 TaxID=1442371 RepID=A0A0D2JW58_9EURO|nr:uncharacterized protein Z520_09434 [Fonsecaea multimorphosa CBS 102226]KIX94744.1 hypothetical protein Z520_09434 [Fonsecaea multimorphosa CBS 102226]OAL20519.1 hypothetical protein AYO22_08820 [Fonsecaea multimorphosa]